MKHSFDNLIWPSNLQLINNDPLKYVQLSKANRFFGRLISITRNTSIALAVLYYITFNYLLPNIDKINQQRSAMCIQNVLKTRSLIKQLEAKISDINQSSIDSNVLSIIHIDSLNSNVFTLSKKLKQSHSLSLENDINEMDNEIQLLTKKINTQILS
ncbi:hypothetical protein ACO0OL_003396 [Hanseniaspora opuntiae]|jgi:hypothetical protein